MKKIIIFITILIVSTLFISTFLCDDCIKITENILQAPSLNHLFGTDGLGRDVFYQCVLSLKNTILIGVGVALISGLIGVIFGILSSSKYKLLNTIINEFINAFMSIPTLILVLLVFTLIEPNFWNLILVISCSMWTGIAKITRIQIKKIKNELFVEQQYMLGESEFYIFVKHIIPHIYKPILSAIILNIPAACAFESSLSFIGIKCTDLSLGAIINHGQDYIFSAWWIIFFPIIIIIILCSTIVLLSDKYNKGEDNYD